MNNMKKRQLKVYAFLKRADEQNIEQAAKHQQEGKHKLLPTVWLGRDKIMIGCRFKP